MNKPLKTTHRHLTFGDLVTAVSSSSRNTREAVAVIADMLNNGRVTFMNSRRRAHRVVARLV